jgi:hypothetical protein
MSAQNGASGKNWGLEAQRGRAFNNFRVHGACARDGNPQNLIDCPRCGRDAPRLTRVKAFVPKGGTLLRSAVQQMIAAADGREAGGQSVLERLTKIIPIELLRHEILAQKISGKGLLSAMTDPVLGRCLAAIRGNPGKA